MRTNVNGRGSGVSTAGLAVGRSCPQTSRRTRWKRRKTVSRSKGRCRCTLGARALICTRACEAVPHQFHVNRAARSVSTRCAFARFAKVVCKYVYGSASQALQSFALKQAVKQLPKGFQEFVGKDGKLDKQGEAALGDYFQK